LNKNWAVKQRYRATHTPDSKSICFRSAIRKFILSEPRNSALAVSSLQIFFALLQLASRLHDMRSDAAIVAVPTRAAAQYPRDRQELQR